MPDLQGSLLVRDCRLQLGLDILQLFLGGFKLLGSNIFAFLA